MKFKEKLILSAIVNLFFSFTILLFGPYEIFIGNSSNLDMPFKEFWWVPAVVASAYLLIATFVFSVFPVRLCAVFNMLVFSFTACCYLQAMFFNSEMTSLLGGEIDWPAGTKAWNLVLWVIIFSVLFLLPIILKNKWKLVVQFLASAIVVMQLTALVSLFINTDALSDKSAQASHGYVSTKNMLNLSEKDNVVVFLLDTFDNRFMNQILEENPDFLAPLDGFTYYKNSTTMYSRTYPSVAYLLTGNKCYFDKEYSAWVNEAADNSNFLPVLAQNNTDIGLYTEMGYIGNRIRGIISNFETDETLNFVSVVKAMVKMVGYRDFPYIIKKRFQYEAAQLNNTMYHNHDYEEDRFLFFDDEWFDAETKNNGLSVSNEKDCFRFYHLAGAHRDFSNPVAWAKRGMEIVYDYLEQMKKMGIYKKSTVMIITDHAGSGGSENLDLPQKPVASLCLVKPSGAAGTKVSVSNAPVSHTDFIPTVLDALSLPHEGKTMLEFKENEKRKRYYYYSAMHSDLEGEIELREYLVDGDANDANSYHFTGKTWDIMYSENKVAEKK